MLGGRYEPERSPRSSRVRSARARSRPPDRSRRRSSRDRRQLDPGIDLEEVRPGVLDEEQANVPRVALELAVGEGSLLEHAEPARPDRSTRRGRAARAGRPRRPAPRCRRTRRAASCEPAPAGGRPRGRARCRPGPAAVARRLGPLAPALAEPRTRPQGVSGADAPARLVISQRPLILATSPSAAVTATTLPVFGST